MNVNAISTPWYKEPWPWILMLGPGIVVIAGFITLWLAIDSSDGVVEGDYYKQGLAINERIHRDHAARDMGVRAEVFRNGALIRLFLSSDKGSPLPAALSFRLTHPTRDGYDQTIILNSEGSGFYAGKLEHGVDASSRWHVFVEDQDSTWRLMGLWKIASEEPLKLIPQQ